MLLDLAGLQALVLRVLMGSSFAGWDEADLGIRHGV